YHSHSGQRWTDEWLYYRMTLDQGQSITGVTVKDYVVSVAMPTAAREWLTDHVSGTLYNFLPTAIRTGYAFHLNGAFFPDNNRRSILRDTSTQPEKSYWNERVIKALGHLVAAAVIDVRDQVDSAARFYELLPLQAPDANPFLA